MTKPGLLYAIFRYVFNAVHTTDWHEPETLERWREAWCQMVNEEFERKGIAVRIDHRSYEAQGIELIPTVHEGPLLILHSRRCLQLCQGLLKTIQLRGFGVDDSNDTQIFQLILLSCSCATRDWCGFASN